MARTKKRRTAKQIRRIVLHQKAILVHVSIRTWTGRVRDQQAAAEVEKLLGMAAGVALFQKNIVSVETLNAIVAQVKKARRALEVMTLPWDEHGMRLLPTSRWSAFQAELKLQRGEFLQEVEKFVVGYDKHKRSMRAKLGTAWREEDYPDKAALRDRFSFRVEYYPVPNVAVLDVDLAAKDIRALKNEIAESCVDRYGEAVKDVYRRLDDAITTLHDQIESGRLGVRANTYEYLASLVDLAPDLNVLGDPTLSRIVETVREDVLSYSAATLRKDDGAKVDVLDTMKTVLALLRKQLA